MYHKKLTINQVDGLYDRILVPRARNKYGVDLATIPHEVYDDIIGRTLTRMVKRRQWNLPAALEYFDAQIESYLARRKG